MTTHEVLGGTVVTLQASGPVTNEAWEQMMTVLTALKQGFVQGEPELLRTGDDEHE